MTLFEALLYYALLLPNLTRRCLNPFTGLCVFWEGSTWGYA